MSGPLIHTPLPEALAGPARRKPADASPTKYGSSVPISSRQERQLKAMLPVVKARLAGADASGQTTGREPGGNVNIGTPARSPNTVRVGDAMAASGRGPTGRGTSAAPADVDRRSAGDGFPSAGVGDDAGTYRSPIDTAMAGENRDGASGLRPSLAVAAEKEWWE